MDTPGFGDSNGEDGVLIDEMVKALKDDIKTTSERPIRPKVVSADTEYSAGFDRIFGRIFGR